jgi:urease accessory protein
MAVALNRKFPLAVPLVIAGVFGFFHGHAHGTEMPLIANPILYALGFTSATALLHVTGVLLGRQAVKFPAGAIGLRVAGGTIAAVGLLLVLAT